MKYIDEYRDPALVRRAAASIARAGTRRWVLMEICGGQTHTILRCGLDTMLPENIEIVHGPGCPVCVTPCETVDQAISLASRPDVILVTYGDMLRIPGSQTDLFSARARGGDVRVAYAPTEAVRIARVNPDKQVVFLAVGFETTAPAHALVLRDAHRSGLRNFSVLASHVRVPPAIRALLASKENRVQAFIAPGHVCAVMGTSEYEAISRDYGVPIVVGGFEPLDLLGAIQTTVELLETGRAETRIGYSRSVTRTGNTTAQRAIEEVFEIADRPWRGLGVIPDGGFRIRSNFSGFDAERRFDLAVPDSRSVPECIGAEVLQGRKRPCECPAFAVRCTPEAPLGAPMVSDEGACAAYFRYRRPLAGAVV